MLRTYTAQMNNEVYIVMKAYCQRSGIKVYSFIEKSVKSYLSRMLRKERKELEGGINDKEPKSRSGRS